MQWTSSTGANPSWMHLLPPEQDEVNEYHVREYFRTMFERQEIWEKRHFWKAPAPWTEDPILRDYKFTNVYRELDRNSQWEINNIIKNPSLSKLDLVWQIMLFRIFNRPEFFEWIKQEEEKHFGRPFASTLLPYRDYDQESFAQYIYKFRETGENPFTNAYLVNSRACPGVTRDQCYGEHIIPTVHANVERLYKVMITSKSPQEIIDFLVQLPGVANFVAYEFYVSFCYVEKYTGRKLFKWNENSWTNVGPGASLGLRLLFPSARSNKDQEARMWQLKEMAPSYLKENFLFFNFYYYDYKQEHRLGCNLTIHQIEMWLCEYQKYWKMVNGIGKQRSLFTPRD